MREDDIPKNPNAFRRGSISNVIIDKNTILEENTTLQGDEKFPIVIEKKVRI
ncbi:hypothetical protein [Clostridium sp.]|uniref:hypothetical protein n=1 Tax=Clostridium sp. TaxID=1506 RepID=UPI003F4C05D0